jgi:hypothetical protein
MSYNRELWMRAIVVVSDDGVRWRRIWDVGPVELEDLIQTSKHIKVEQLGRYGRGQDGNKEWAYDSEEGERVRALIEKIGEKK